MKLLDSVDTNIAIRDWNPDQTQDASWPYKLDDESLIRWNKLYPYQLLIVERRSDGTYKKSDTYGPFTLPVPPQDLGLSTAFAITTTATLGGIVEEHNGAPFRMISVSGTTGVLPARGTGEMIKDPSSIGTIFAGTLSAVDRVAGSFNSLLAAGPKNNSTYSDTDFRNKTFGALTGYYQFRLLQRFLESYVTLKKKASGKNLRLGWAQWKDEAIYLCTPMQFDVRRTAGSALEYSYSLTLKAWKRIKLDDTQSSYDRAGPSTRDPSLFSTVLNKLQEARTVLQNARDVITAVGGDVDASLLGPLREVVYFAKDALGIAVAAADLPKSVIQNLKASCTEAMALNRIDMKLKDYYQQTGKSIEDDFADIKALGVDSGKAETGSGGLSSSQSALVGASPAVALFDAPEQHYDFLATLTVSDLNVPRTVQNQIDAETTRVRALTRLDFEKTRDTVQAFSAEFSDAIGAGAATFNTTFGRTGRTTTRTPTPDEWDVVFALNQVVQEMNRLAASGNINRGQVSTLNYIAGLAQASGIAFKVPTSKYAVPFPYGSTLEMVALSYLGDAQRWMEIAALNGLQSPYVDEEGFDLFLAVNGNGNQIQVADASNLYVGQQVWISSSNTSRTVRRIVRVEKITNNYTITVDGDADLDRFSTLALAYVHAFLPNTCNSMQVIYIPSDLPATDPDDRLKAIPGINEFDPLIQVAGIDLLLTSSGDLAMTPDGDCQIAVGLANIVQKVRVALGTPKGSMIHFPSYGLNVSLGMNVADLDIADVKTSIQNLLISDPTFAGISGVQIEVKGPTMRISFGVTVKGVDQVIPVSFAVLR